MLALYRLGSYIPAPGVNSDALERLLSDQTGILNLLTLFSGGGLERLGLFALGIMPYITASIILQVMTPVFPSLQALQKEGEMGQRRITQYTRYLTVFLAVAQAIGYTFLFSSGSSAIGGTGGAGGLINTSIRNYVLVIVTLTAGAAPPIWACGLIPLRRLGYRKAFVNSRFVPNTAAA